MLKLGFILLIPIILVCGAVATIAGTVLVCRAIGRRNEFKALALSKLGTSTKDASGQVVGETTAGEQ